MSSGLLFGTNSIFAKIDTFTSFGLDRKLDDMLGLTPPEIKGPRLSDLTVQTSTYGAHIPRLYGTISVMGNVIWLENGKYKETVRKKKKGGKGGGGSSEPTTTYSYSATFHLSLCEGPIAGIRRMWCGDKLLYNAGSDDLETIIASNKAAKGWKLYLGTDSQLPDSRYEANVGVGNASAHRGMAYIAFYDFQLADYSNALQGAQFKVEVVSVAAKSNTLLFDYLVDSGVGLSFLTDRHSNVNTSKLKSYFTSPNFNSGAPALLSITKDGRVDVVEFNDFSFLINSLGYEPDIWPADILSADTLEAVFYGPSSNITLNRAPSLIVRISGKEKLYDDPTYYNNRRMYERAGHIWQRWTNASNTATFLAKMAFDGPPTLLGDGAYPINQNTSTGGGVLAPTQDGYIVECFFAMEPGHASATVSVTVRDAYYSIIRSGSFSLNRFDNTPNQDFTSSTSAGYVDDGGLLNVAVHEDYSVFGHQSGRFFLFRYNINTMEFVDSRELISAANSAEDFVVSTISVRDGVLVVGKTNPSAGSKKVGTAAFAIDLINDQQISLSSVIQSEALQASLISSADIDVSLLADSVRGYRVSGGTARSNLEPLQAAYHFDVRPHGYKIQFLPRGQASVVTIPWDDLGATDGDTPKDIFQQSREMDPQLPARTVVKYLDAAREYAIGEQSSERLNTEAINRVDRELALVLTADEAAGVAEVMNFLPWLERSPAAFTLPPIYRYLEPGDVATVAAPTATYELRVTEIGETQDGRLECKALPSRAALYSPAAIGAEGVPATGTIGLAGESLFIPMDIPVIDETMQDAPGFVGAMTGYTDGWPGGIVVRSSDDGQTWTDLQAYTGKATIGTARGTLPVSNCTLIDQRTLIADLISGELDSVTRDQMLAGVNYAAYGVDGRWEIVRFQNATLQSDGSYLLSGFLRGEKGTEWATGLHAADDYFVLLDDPDNAFIGSSVESILAPRLYRGITSGGSLDDAVDVPFTYKGVNLECLSPVYARGARDGSSNFAGTFTRRSRLGSSWWATGVVAPVGESSESYEIDVMSGSAVKRTIAVTSPSFAYSAVNQVADFGSAQASITFRIYQLSATVGRGYPLEVTL